MSQPFNLLDHLEFVRLRLIRAALYFVGASVVGFSLTPFVMDLLVGEGKVRGLIFLSPAEAFFARFKLALTIGLLIGLPFILYQAWGLIEPALDSSKKKLVWILIPTAYFLFVGGVLFSFIWVLPVALQFLLGFGEASGLVAEISVANYISFLIGLLLPFGLVFQLPVIIVFLTRLGIIQPEKLASQRKYVVLIAFVIGAVLTPPDVITQVMLAVPLLALFELSLLVARLIQPKERDGSNSDYEPESEV